MTPYYALYEAKRRLVMTKETIDMMGGENECPAMVLGQRDMLELEVDYYRGRVKITTFWLTILTFCVTMVILHYYYGVI